MNKPFSDIVYKVISHALELKERLDRGQMPDIAAERHQLLTMIRGEGEGRRLSDYMGDGVFLGARYALACWVDELFIIHCQPPWADQWKEKTIEDEIFRTALAATKFWEQADIVLQRPGAPRSGVAPGADAAETYFLCAVLGFRGNHWDNIPRICEYVQDMRFHLASTKGWQSPQDLGVKTNVDPLLGRSALRRVVAIYGSAALAVVLALLALWKSR
jgi:type VI protein secretion system component VasF